MVAEEHDLVRRCLARDPSGLRAFVERFQDVIFGLCFRMLRHRQDAEDVTQDVFVRAFRHLSGWDSARPLKPWLLTIAANRCRTALLKRARQPLVQEFLVEAVQGPASGIPADLAEELNAALGTLREEYRLCFVLFHDQELGYAEIADVLGCPTGTVRTWLHRARRELAILLEGRGVTGMVHHELH